MVVVYINILGYSLMKHWKIKVTAIALVMTMFLCSGCLSGIIYKRSGNLVEDLYQKHHSERYSQEISDEIVAEVFGAAEDNDFSRIRVLFSEYAIENTPDLEEQFDQFCDFCSYDIRESDGNADYIETSTYAGHYLMYTLCYEFKLEGDDTRYILHIGWVADNVNDTSQIGIQYVEVLRYEDCNPGEYWGYGNDTGFHIITDEE